MERAARVYAVVVTHNGGAAVGRTLELVLTQVDRLLIFDNASNPDSLEPLRRFASENASLVQLIESPDNVGIAAALNRAAERAVAQGFDWLLTLDQDSLCRPDLVSRLLEAWERHADRTVAVVVPYSREGGMTAPPRRDVGPWEELRWIHTSGNLIRVDALARIGPFREEFFIDQVDYDFCLRTRRAGFRIFRVNDAVMEHHLGNRTQARLFHRSVACLNYSPARRYYQTRNAAVLIVEARDWDFAKACIDSNVRELAKVILFERDKRAKIAAMLSGLRDAARGRLGPLR